MNNLNNPTLDNTQPNPNETVGQGIEVPENIENTAEVVEKTTGEKINKIDDQVGIDEKKIADLSTSVEKTKSDLNSIRESLGIPTKEEDPHSVLAGKDQIEKLEKEKEELEKQKEQLISQEEKEKLIQAEKEKILQEKINQLFEEFKSSKPEDFQIKISNSVNKEDAKVLTQAFSEGIKQLPDLINKIPKILEELDKEITKEATERVEKKIEEGQQKIQEAKAEEMMTPEQKAMSEEREQQFTQMEQGQIEEGNKIAA